MANGIVRVLPLPKGEYAVNPNKWIGRLATFELVTGSRVSGRIIAINDIWVDTDNGAIRIEHIVHAKWISDEEAQITHGGPLGNYNRQLKY
jgi:hypothetical protein